MLINVIIILQQHNVSFNEWVGSRMKVRGVLKKPSFANRKVITSVDEVVTKYKNSRDFEYL